MKPYKRHKLGMLAVIAVMSISGTVFASEPQIVPKTNTTGGYVIESAPKVSTLKMKKNETKPIKKASKKKHRS
jgi:hypothetical protein